MAHAQRAYENEGRRDVLGALGQALILATAKGIVKYAKIRAQPAALRQLSKLLNKGKLGKAAELMQALADQGDRRLYLRAAVMMKKALIRQSRNITKAGHPRSLQEAEQQSAARGQLVSILRALPRDDRALFRAIGGSWEQEGRGKWIGLGKSSKALSRAVKDGDPATVNFVYALRELHQQRTNPDYTMANDRKTLEARNRDLDEANQRLMRRQSIITLEVAKTAFAGRKVRKEVKGLIDQARQTIEYLGSPEYAASVGLSPDTNAKALRAAERRLDKAAKRLPLFAGAPRRIADKLIKEFVGREVDYVKRVAGRFNSFASEIMGRRYGGVHHNAGSGARGLGGLGVARQGAGL